MQPEHAPSLGREHPPHRFATEAAAAARIILVDDDAAVRASLKFSLELEGFEVEDFASAEAAASVTVDDNSVLLIDYRLPGIDGLALLSLLRKRGVDAPAIVITSNPTRKLRQAIDAAGATLIEKPLLCDLLTTRIRAMFDRVGG